MFCFESVVRYSEVDADGFMKLPSILDLMQDCCIFQSEELGIGLDFLRSANRVWALSSWQVIIRRYPNMGERLKAYTWPYRFQSFLGYRNFKIEDARGEEIACANSIWAFLDTKSGRPARIPKGLSEKYPFEPPYPAEFADRRLRRPKDMQTAPAITAGRFCIDTNRHVNNGKYVLLAQEYLPEDFKAGSLRAEYKKSAVLADRIVPGIVEEEGKITVSLENEAGEPYAIVEFMEDGK